LGLCEGGQAATLILSLHQSETPLIRFRRSPYMASVVMLCMALCVVLANQSYIVLVDQTKHALHQEHAPNPLAGAVERCGDHHHDHNNLHHHCGDEDHALDSSVTHLHLDSTIVYILSSPPVFSVLRQSTFVDAVVPDGIVRLYPYRLDRPPKA